MKKKILPFILLSILLPSFLQTKILARDLKACIAILPPHSEIGTDGIPKGGFVEIVKLIDSVYTGGNIITDLLPVSRSANYVITGKADFFIPYVRHNMVKIKNLPFLYASEPVLQVNFVLYTRADKQKVQMNNPEKYHLETLRGAAMHFPFKIFEIDSFSQGILKVLKGRSDGFIAEQDATDIFIRKRKIKNIRRTLYSRFDSCIMIKKGKDAKEVDRIISTALRKLKRSGKLQKITRTIHKPYNNWQPYKMNWKDQNIIADSNK